MYCGGINGIMVKTPITVKLSKPHIATLHRIGGNTKGIEFLISEYLKTPEIEKEPESPDVKFFEQILLPKEVNLRSTYIAYLNSYLKRGIKSEAIGYSINEIMGETGFDEGTIRKQFRKMTGSSYVKLVGGSMFRPTIRLQKGYDRADFALILEEYITLLRGEGRYEDVLGDPNDEC